MTYAEKVLDKIAALAEDDNERVRAIEGEGYDKDSTQLADPDYRKEIALTEMVLL